MAYFAAILEMENAEKNQAYRPQHLEYLQKQADEGRVLTCGPFGDGSGGLVIYIADSYTEAQKIAEQDPYVVHGVRRLDLREWKIGNIGTYVPN